jgi:hypothetical protein
MNDHANIFDDLPQHLPKELVQILIRAADVRIERIISHGQRHFRHKTKKLSFLIVFWIAVVLHVGVVGGAAYRYFGPVEWRGSPRHSAFQQMD